AISSGLVRLLNGTLTFHSSEGKGSTFTFSIPWEISKTEVALVSAPGDPPWCDPAIADPVELDAARPRVLIVEDTPDSQIYFSRVVRRVGAEVHLAADGVQALESCGEREFDLILMDIRMEKLDGFQTLAELRRRGLRVPVIAVTAHAMPGDRETCLKAGFADYLAKPVSKDALIRKVQHFLGGPRNLNDRKR